MWDFLGGWKGKWESGGKWGVLGNWGQRKKMGEKKGGDPS